MTTNTKAAAEYLQNYARLAQKTQGPWVVNTTIIYTNFLLK